MLKKIVLSVIISIILIGVVIHFVAPDLFGVPVLTIAKSVFSIATAPSVEEIKELPVEEVNSNVHEFIDALSEVDLDEELQLVDGPMYVRVVDGDEAVDELTLNITDGNITAIDYSLPPGLHEAQIVEIPELMFRMSFSGHTPDNLPELIEDYKRN